MEKKLVLVALSLTTIATLAGCKGTKTVNETLVSPEVTLEITKTPEETPTLEPTPSLEVSPSSEVTMEPIPEEVKYGEKIKDQCFDAKLNPLGSVSFVSYDADRTTYPYANVVFKIEKDNKELQELDGLDEEQLHVKPGYRFMQIDAVAFQDVNKDGYNDIITICSYLKEDNSSYQEVRYYTGSYDGTFVLQKELSENIINNLESYTVKNVAEYINNRVTNLSSLDVDKQLQIIANNKKLWDFEDACADYSIAVTDFDQDGKLEVIAASLQGTGFYTYIKIFEVNDEMNGLVEIKHDDMESAECLPDYTWNSVVPVYKQNDTYYYIMDDYTRGGVECSSNIICAVSLEGKKLVENGLAMWLVEYKDADNSTETYSLVDGKDTKITKEEYEKIAETTFAQGEKKEAVFGWQQMKCEELKELSEDAVLGLLKTSAATFEIR